jgi:hypothetical protein
MAIASDWKMNATLELGQADAARAVGNEGRARVCARRAAGILAREFLGRRGVLLASPSAHNVLRQLISLPELSPEAREVAAHFVMHVDTGFALPEDVDLLAETRWLAETLMGETL